jgi:hypothetical protein
VSTELKLARVTQIHKYISTNQVFVSFHTNHSCETILLKLTDDWLEAMDKGLFTRVVMIDLRKAFDVVDHAFLLRKLEIYGLDFKTLKLLQSYLDGRSQKVCIDGMLSKPLLIESGVPHGSILGPALFLIFPNDLPLTLANNIGLYADDSTLYTSDSTIPEVEEKLKPDLIDVSTWVKDNKMKLHQSKTKYSTISSCQKLANSSSQSLNLTFDGETIIQVKSERVLGVYIDNHLTWSTHIEKLHQKLLKRTAVLARVRKYVPTHYRLMLYNASINPLFEYYCSDWSNYSQGNIDDLFKLQKRVQD